VDSEATMFAGTFQTDPDAVCDADPLRTVCSAIKTTLHRQTDRQTDRHIAAPPQIHGLRLNALVCLTLGFVGRFAGKAGFIRM